MKSASDAILVSKSGSLSRFAHGPCAVEEEGAPASGGVERVATPPIHRIAVDPFEDDHILHARLRENVTVEPRQRVDTVPDVLPGSFRIRLPPMPASSTEGLAAVPGAQARERYGGPRPSLVESPKVTTADAESVVSTSTPVRKTHEVIVAGRESSVAPINSSCPT